MMKNNTDAGSRMHVLDCVESGGRQLPRLLNELLRRSGALVESKDFWLPPSRAPTEEIRKLLRDEVSEALSAPQKLNRIRNLPVFMSREDGTIRHEVVVQKQIPRLGRNSNILKRWLMLVAGGGPSRKRNRHGRLRIMSRQRLECVELAPAVVRPRPSERASKLDAVHTLREPGCRQPAQRLQQPGVAGHLSEVLTRESPPGGLRNQTLASMRIAAAQKNAAKGTFVPPVAHSRLSRSLGKTRMPDRGNQAELQEILAGLPAALAAEATVAGRFPR